MNDKQVKTMRQQLNREDFREHQKETPLQKNLRLAGQVRDPDLKESYTAAAKMVQMAEETYQGTLQKLGQQSTEEIDQDGALLLREKALDLGPTRMQKIRWLVSDFYKALCAFAPHLLWPVSFVFDNMGWVYATTWVMLILSAVGMVAGTGMGNQFVFMLITIVVAAIIGMASDTAQTLSDQRRRNRHIAHLFGTAAMALLIASTTFWWSFAPEDGNIGVIRENGEVMNVINTDDLYFMKPPKFWSQTTQWYELTSPNKSNQNSDHYQEMWTRGISFKGMQGQLHITSTRQVNLEGMKKLLQAGKDPSIYRDDLLKKVEAAIDRRFPKNEVGEISLDVMALTEEVNSVYNELYWLGGTQVQIQFANSSIQSQ